MTASTLDCALWLAAHGMHVFEVDHPALTKCVGAHRPEVGCDGKRGKHPCGKWSRTATTDPETVHRMFSGRTRNIGIACKASGLVVVDEDERDALARYGATVGVIVEPTFTVLTSRGAHRYYWQPAGEQLGNSPGALAPFHIDVRGGGVGNGGFVVGPGSVHESGHEYRPLDSTAPVAPAPAWLIEAIRPAADSGKRGSLKMLNMPKDPRAVYRPGAIPKRIAALLAVVLDAPRPSGPDRPGGRNSALFWASCRMAEAVRDGAIPETEGKSMLLAAAEDTGLQFAEAAPTIDSAFRSTTGRG